ncbi:hypothetical protein B0O80DRAFT_107402 [Mortierella sp. GBAus27b]|nr:hypothetical protein B0O80DRAFT_107402 [Mortierella sp. GBAus27b]
MEDFGGTLEPKAIMVASVTHAQFEWARSVWHVRCLWGRTFYVPQVDHPHLFLIRQPFTQSANRPAASCPNQPKQPTKATNQSNQPKQPTKATNQSNQPKQPTKAKPKQGTKRGRERESCPYYLPSSHIPPLSTWCLSHSGS